MASSHRPRTPNWQTGGMQRKGAGGSTYCRVNYGELLIVIVCLEWFYYCQKVITNTVPFFSDQNHICFSHRSVHSSRRPRTRYTWTIPKTVPKARNKDQRVQPALKTVLFTTPFTSLGSSGIPGHDLGSL